MIQSVLAAPNVAPYRPELTIPTDGSPFGAQINAFFADCIAHGYNVGYLRPGSVTAEVPVSIPSKFDVVGMGRGDTTAGADSTVGRLAWGGGVKIASPFNSNTPAIAMLGKNTGNDTSGMVISPGLYNVSVTGACNSTKALSASGPTTLIDIQNVYRLRMANVWAGNDFLRVLRLSNVWDSDIWSFSSNSGGFSDPSQSTDNATVTAYTGRNFLGVETAIGRSLGVPAVEIISPNTDGGDVINNLRIYSMHLESNAQNGVPFMARGGNGGTVQCIGCKIEANDGCVPMIVLDGQHGFRYEGWLMAGGTGAPYVTMGGVAAGTSWSSYAIPAVALANGCFTPKFDVSIAHNPYGGTAPSLFRFINCTDPQVDANVTDGLAKITSARMIFDGCTDVSATHTRCYAPPYLLSVSGANQMERSNINGTTLVA